MASRSRQVHNKQLPQTEQNKKKVPERMRRQHKAYQVERRDIRKKKGKKKKARLGWILVNALHKSKKPCVSFFALSLDLFLQCASSQSDPIISTLNESNNHLFIFFAYTPLRYTCINFSSIMPMILYYFCSHYCIEDYSLFFLSLSLLLFVNFRVRLFIMFTDLMSSGAADLCDNEIFFFLRYIMLRFS